MKYDLDSYEQAQSLMNNLWPKVKESLKSGKKFMLEIKEQSKTRDQERLYHAIISDISKQAQHMGAKWEAEDWKRLLVDQFMRQHLEVTKVIPNLDNNGIVQLGFQTRNFTKEQASEFVEFLLAWCVENGIELKETI